MLVPISDADRNEGAFAIRASGTQAVIWDFFPVSFQAFEESVGD
ncbi:hypothetical protein SIAM614_08309 [Stappia aggregata IAM 12614]|uniref:Uncharacterized protein n=1 Tax=Roseibium aggregatum (strain ATCC 25650 / DSM 13394 / JCM 20685 / NBRC 16684 / NCIMB 2208 / IAM 12614 / B1) TaxID=384765 RepID=A0P225_ROSAI|nr:hypothetical protein SIAM614_08309 [Stappia aggregata IAM 12614] [Roseibium aggregatum IAM 12614]